jgi:hypothetical protein
MAPGVRLRNENSHETAQVVSVTVQGILDESETVML